MHIKANFTHTLCNCMYITHALSLYQNIENTDVSFKNPLLQKGKKILIKFINAQEICVQGIEGYPNEGSDANFQEMKYRGIF